MRHRASRPFIDVWLRVPRVIALALGLAAGPRRTRVLGSVVAALALGVGGYALVAAMTGGSPTPQEEPSVAAEPPAPGPPESAAPSTRSGTPRPTERATERPEEHAAPASPLPETPSPASSASPSPTGGPVTVPPSVAGSPTASPRRVTSTATDDDVTPPDTTLVQETLGAGGALLTFSADEAATFMCSLDGAAFTTCDSVQRYADLDPGWHTFAVRATDQAGNVDAGPATARWLSTNGEPVAAGDR